MKYIYVGKLVNTHALKGEVRILSNFEFKAKVFKINSPLYVGNYKEKLLIRSYRRHKSFDMVTFEGIDNINDVLKYKGMNVYTSDDDLNLSDNEILPEDLIDMEVILNDKVVGKITEYRCDNGNKMVRLNDKFIPYNNDFITKVDKENKKVYYHDIEVFL